MDANTQTPVATEARRAPVKPTPAGKKKQLNTLALPPMYAALYPLRLSADFGELDQEVDYHPDLVDSLLKEFAGLELQAMPMREGYLYVFVDGYLFREYRVTRTSEEKALFQAVNLTLEQGKDNRNLIEGLKAPFVLVPAQSDSVEMAFSAHQWSWLRINSLGGLPQAAPNRVIASNDDNLAVNDSRLEHQGDTAALESAAESARKNRLQDVTYQQSHDYLSWQPLKKLARDSEPFQTLVISEHQDQLASSDKQFIDDLVIGVGSCVIHDHLDTIDQLCKRHGLAMSLMTTLLKDLQNPDLTGEKAQRFPNAQHFASAALIHQELISYGVDGKGADGKKQSYYDNALSDYRKYIHVETLQETLGVTHRKKVNELLELTLSQLTQWLNQDIQSDSYPSLTRQGNIYWQHALIDYLACPFENDESVSQGDSQEQPLAELFYEFLGGLCSHLCTHPRSLDLSIDGSPQDYQQYRNDLIQSKSLAWIEEMLRENSQLWQAALRAHLPESVPRQVQDDETPVGNTPYFKVSRRMIQAISGIFQIHLVKPPEAYEQFGKHTKLAVIDGFRQLLGVNLKEAKLGEVIDTPLESEEALDRTIKKNVSQNPVLISQFFRQSSPEVLDEYGGETADEIIRKSQAEKEQLISNMAVEEEALQQQWDQAEKLAFEEADNTYADVKAALAREANHYAEVIQSQKDDIRQLQLAYHDQQIALETKARSLNTEQALARNNRQKAQYAVSTAQADLDSAVSRLTTLQASQKSIQHQINQKTEQALTEAERLQAYYSGPYGIDSANEAVSEYLKGEQARINQLKSELPTQSEIDSAEGRIQQARSTLQDAENHLAAADNTLRDANQTVQDNADSLARLEQDHADNLKTQQDHLKDYETAQTEFEKSRQATQNSAYQDSKAVKARASNIKQRKQKDYESEKANQLSEHDRLTREKIVERNTNKVRHDTELDEKAKRAREEGRQVIDLRTDTGKAEWKQYQWLRENGARQVRAYNKNDYKAQIEQQGAVREAIRPDGTDKTNFSIDPKKYEDLTGYKKNLVHRAIVEKAVYDRYIERVKSHSVITVTIDSAEKIYKTYVGEEARRLGTRADKTTAALNGVLAIVEVINLHGAYHSLAKNKSGYEKLNFLGTVLDSAASLEALAISMKSGAGNATASAIVRKATRGWALARTTPLTTAAAFATFAWFGYEAYRAASLRNWDDAFISYSVLMAGSSLLIAQCFGYTILGVATGGVGIAVVLVGSFLLHCVFRANTDELEYTLSRGPFGADRYNLAYLGIENVVINDSGEYVEVRLEGRDRIRLEHDTYRIKSIIEGVDFHGHIPRKNTNFIRHQDNSYSYQAPKGLLQLGKPGELLGNGDINDPADLEQYFNAPFQDPDTERFDSDRYIDDKLEYEIAGELWKDRERSAKSYHESVINALYPLELEMDLIKKPTSNHGRMLLTFSHKLRLSYKIPYYQETCSDPTFRLLIENKNLNELKLINIFDLINNKYKYVENIIDNGKIAIEIDLDDKEFQRSQNLESIFNEREHVVLTAILSCKNNINGVDYHQPPLIENETDPNRKNQARQVVELEFGETLKNDQ